MRSQKYGYLGALLQVGNRFAEMIYRHLVVGYFQWHGYTIISDRHFLFDARTHNEQQRFWFDRTLDWLNRNAFPQPDLIILLWARPEILHARKGESNITELAARQRRYLEQGKQLKNFKCLNAERPVDTLIGEIRQLLNGEGASAGDDRASHSKDCS